MTLMAAPHSSPAVTGAPCREVLLSLLEKRNQARGHTATLDTSGKAQTLVCAFHSILHGQK